ncbi:MAG: tRNA (adenosine(37)-N6)-dimethylallyltransferase MiaA [Planctomycetota bacterium]
MKWSEDCWFLSGATASGKTDVGVALARQLDAEVLSLDSMTLYRGMDIGTAKPDQACRQAVPHHLIDICEPTEEFSLSNYLEAAEPIVADIRQRGKRPLFVGGTPLYLKALLRGVDTGPPADWAFRKEVEQEVERVGVAALHERLQQVDPLAAAKLPPTDVRRIIRALEVYRATGKPISHVQMHFEEGVPAEQRHVFVLRWPRETQYQRIEQRVDRMFADGLVEEATALQQKYGELSRTAAQAVGYREVYDHLEGRQTLEETMQRIKTRTRRFAKRQGTWFRGLSECRFVDLEESASPENVAQAIMEQAATGGT